MSSVIPLHFSADGDPVPVGGHRSIMRALYAYSKDGGSAQTVPLEEAPRKALTN